MRCLSLFLLSATLAFSDPGSGFNPAQIEALELIKNSQFRHSILECPNGRPVVVMGEVHIQGKEATEAQYAIARAFQYYGYEGVQWRNRWLGSWVKSVIERDYDRVQKKPGQSNSYLRSIKEFHPKSECWLEEGHQPDTKENFTLVTMALSKSPEGWALLIGNTVATPCSLALPLLGRNWKSHSARNLLNKASGALAITTLGAATTTVGLMGTGRVLTRMLLKEDPKCSTGLNGNRNVTMARNLAQWCNQIPEPGAPILVIVGRAHVAGLSYHAQNNHAFKILSESTK